MFSALRNFSRNTTFLGYRYLVDPELYWIERVFWICSIIGSSGLGIFLMVYTYDDFQKHPISQTVDTLYLGWETRLPTIIFCENANPSKIDEILRESFNESIVSSCSEGLLEYIFFRGRIARAPCQDIDLFEELDLLNVYNQSLSSCAQLFTFCEYQGHVFNCCEGFRPVETLEGICYALNSATNPSTTLPVYKFTDDAHLIVELKSLMYAYFTSAEELLTIKEGNQLLPGIIGERSRYIIYGRAQEIVNDDRIARVPVNLRGCRFPAENYLKTTNVYSHSACVVECVEHIHDELRGCVAHILPSARRGTYKVCKKSDLFFLAENRDNIIMTASKCQCELSCNESEIYRIGVMEKRLFNDFTDDATILRVELKMIKSFMRYSRNLVKDNVDLIVSFGGIGTLFLGASLLSIIEIFYYFFVRPYGDRYIVKIKLRNRKGHRKRVYPMESRIQTIQVTPMPTEFEKVNKKYASMRKPYPYLQ